MRPLADGAEVGEAPGAPLCDEAPHETLAGEAREHRRRRPVPARDQIGRQAAEGDDLDVGDGAQAPHQEVADAGAHGARPDDHGDGRQRLAALELEDALDERVLELREATDDEATHAATVPQGEDGAQRCDDGAERDPRAWYDS